MIFKRKLYDEMLEWKTWNGQYALLIKGARRVGKSTLAKEFAQREYRSYNMKTPVAQMLVASGNKLFYYTFPKDANHNYEIDFLLSRGNKLVPIEVKSSGYKTHKSLDVFCDKYSQCIGERILLYTKDYCKDGQTTCVPVYFTPFLRFVVCFQYVKDRCLPSK